MSRATAGLIGLLAAALALGATELASGLLPGGQSVFVAVGDAVIELTPGAVVRFAIATFGSQNRLVLLLSMTVVMAVAGVVIGIAASKRRAVGAIGIAAFGLLGVLAASSEPTMPILTAVLAPTVGALAGIVALEALFRVAPGGGPGLAPALGRRGGTAPAAAPTTSAPAPSASPAASTARTTVVTDPAAPATVPTAPTAPAGPTADPRDPPGSRRAFLQLAATVAGGAAAFAVVGRSLQAGATSEATRAASQLPRVSNPLPAPGPDTMVDVPGIAPLITPNEDFFRIDSAWTVPRVDGASHKVRITGMVDTPFEISYDELLDLADTEAYVTLSCVSNEVGGRLIGTAKWLGVPLADLLERAGVQPGATQLVGWSVDGWSGGFPVEAALDGRTALVAVGMNDEPLPARHGFPVRLVIGGLYGYVSNTKWLSEIELTTFEDHEAYWIPRGWSQMGPIKTQSRIDVPKRNASVEAGTVAVAGVAWSDERGLTGVEVAVDDGPWQQAELAEAVSQTSWRQWRLAWDATPGTHELKVRAFDADGEPQTPELAPPAPDGATGHHTIRVSVT